MIEELQKDLVCIQKDLTFSLNEMALVSIKKKEILKDILNERENLEYVKKFFNPLIETYKKGIEEYEKRILDFKQWFSILDRDIYQREISIKKQFKDLLNIKLQTMDLDIKIKEKEKIEKAAQTLFENFLTRRDAYENTIKGLASRMENLTGIIENLNREIDKRKVKLFELDANIKSKENEFNETMKIISEVKKKEKELQERENDIVVMEQRIRPKYFNKYKSIYK